MATPNLMVDFTAQQPLGHFQAIEKGVELRNRGHMWTWAAIADAMALYHGFDRAPSWWRKTLRGKVPNGARGNAFTRESEVNRNGFMPEVRAEAVRRYVAGESSTKVGSTVGCQPHTVRRWVREAGHEVRDRQWRPGQ